MGWICSLNFVLLWFFNLEAISSIFVKLLTIDRDKLKRQSSFTFYCVLLFLNSFNVSSAILFVRSQFEEQIAIVGSGELEENRISFVASSDKHVTCETFFSTLRYVPRTLICLFDRLSNSPANLLLYIERSSQAHTHTHNIAFVQSQLAGSQVAFSTNDNRRRKHATRRTTRLACLLASRVRGITQKTTREALNAVLNNNSHINLFFKSNTYWLLVRISFSKFFRFFLLLILLWSLRQIFQIS